MDPTRFDPERVRSNVRKAETADLLDRATVYRDEMESEALAIIEDELRTRGVTAVEIEAHARRREGHVLAARCSFCRRPAVATGWGWHRLWGFLPVFPRRYRYCESHRPARG